MNLSPAEVAATEIVEEEEEEEEEDELPKFSLFEEEEEEKEKEKEESGHTIAEQLKEAEKQVNEVSVRESVLDKLKEDPITTYSVQRLGCASHKV